LIKETAGLLSQKANRDTTKYNAIEVGHALADDITPHLMEAIANYHNLIDEEEFCVVMVIAKDPLIPNLMRRKFYCWPYLPKPRPNQSVFLYNKALDRITKRLWVLPSDMVMAELAGTNILVHKKYQTMQAWSVAFFKGTFWEYIRHESQITMPSEHEYFLAHRQELIDAGCNLSNSNLPEAFDFSKINVNKVEDPTKTIFE
jgi:hypothetical protein